jgi:hypothetical protein
MDSPIPLSYVTPAKNRSRGIGEKTVVSSVFLLLAWLFLAIANVVDEHGSNTKWYVDETAKYWALHCIVRAALGFAICGLGYAIWTIRRGVGLLGWAVLALCLNTITTLICTFVALCTYVS